MKIAPAPPDAKNRAVPVETAPLFQPEWGLSFLDLNQAARALFISVDEILMKIMVIILLVIAPWPAVQAQGSDSEKLNLALKVVDPESPE